MKFIHTIKNFLRNTYLTVREVPKIKEGIEKQTKLLNAILAQLTETAYAQQQGVAVTNSINVNDGLQAPPNKDNKPAFEKALQKNPLMFAPKTFNTSHPDYDATLVRNFPGKIFNVNNSPNNPVYCELKKLKRQDEIPDAQWTAILKETLDEVKSIPHADEVFQRKAYVENYLIDLEKKYGGFYRPGWVNMDDALFLYWVVRRLKPRVIVQTGVCNGLSSAFMMLALAKNGPEGTLHVVDMPPVFDPSDSNWKIKGKVYGVVIPEGKTSGWLVPDAYRDRFEVLNGDAKLLLPDLLRKLGKVDMFYHDSDHTYDHMMFEFTEAKQYLTPSSVIVSDDISWNSSLWDFADEHNVPAYNYKGSMGIACL